MGVVVREAGRAAAVKGLPVAGEPTAVAVGDTGLRREADPVGMGLHVHCPQDLSAHGVGGLTAAVEVEDEIADAGLPEPPGDDVEGGPLLCDEQDAAPLRDRTDDDVGDRLRLARAGRPFDDKGPPRQGPGDNLRLRRVGGNREPGDQLLEARDGRIRRGVVELRVRRINEMVDQGVPGDGLPGLLEVLPQPEGAELEDSEIGRGLDMEGQPVLRQNPPDDVEQPLEVNPGPVLLRLAEFGQVQTEVGAQPLDEGVVRHRGPGRVDSQAERTAGRAPFKIHGDEDERGAHPPPLTLPDERAEGEIEIVGAGLLGQGPRRGAQTPQCRVVDVLGEIDLDLPVIAESRGELGRVELIAEQSSGAAHERRPLARLPQSDDPVGVDEVLEVADDRLRHGQLDDLVAPDGGVGAVDEAVAKAEVQQPGLPLLDPVGGLPARRSAPGPSRRLVGNDENTGPRRRDVLDLGDVAVLGASAQGHGDNAAVARLADRDDDIDGRCVRPDPLPGRRVHLRKGGSTPFCQHCGLDETDLAAVDLVDQVPAGHRQVLGHVLLGPPVADERVPGQDHNERLDAEILQHARHEDRRVQAGAQTSFEDVLGSAHSLSVLSPAGGRHRVSDVVVVDGVAQRLDDLRDPFGRALVSLQRAGSCAPSQNRGGDAAERGQDRLLRLDEGRKGGGVVAVPAAEDPLPRREDGGPLDQHLPALISAPQRQAQAGGRLGLDLKKSGAVGLECRGRLCAVRGEAGKAEHDGPGERLAVALDDGGHPHIRQAPGAR